MKKIVEWIETVVFLCYIIITLAIAAAIKILFELLYWITKERK